VVVILREFPTLSGAHLAVRTQAVASEVMHFSPSLTLRIPRMFAIVALATAPVAIGFAPSASAAKKTVKTTKKAKVSETTTSATTPTAANGKARKVNVKAEVESRLTKLQQQASPDLVVGKATCPATMASVQVVSKKSASRPVVFRCTILVEGVAAPYDVEVHDGGFQNGGAFLMARAKAIIDMNKVVEGTKAQLDESDRSSATISCGPAKVLIANVGDKINCTVKYPDGTGNQALVYEVRDLDGTIALKL
jgi:hypothetical protein